MKCHFNISSEPAMHQLAASFAAQANAGDCFVLQGELGAGKTAFCRGFIEALMGGDTVVASPTFNLVQTYDVPDGRQIWHYDLYRLKSAEELLELGLDEAFIGAMVLIEWPELAVQHLPDDLLALHIEITSDGGRKVTCQASGEKMTELLRKVEDEQS